MIRSTLLLASLALTTAAFGQTAAAGSISFTQLGDVYTYDITLQNTGTTAVGTLWYAWIPGENYLPLVPTATSGPAGWTFTRTTSANFGSALRWVAPAGGTIAPDASLSGFSFTTTTTPGELAGNSIFGNNPPVGTTFVYEGGPFTGGSSRFVIRPVPEPASMAALGFGALALLRRRSRRLRA